MKKFEVPAMEIIRIKCEDVIATSSEENSGFGGGRV